MPLRFDDRAVAGDEVEAARLADAADAADEGLYDRLAREHPD